MYIHVIVNTFATFRNRLQTRIEFYRRVRKIYKYYSLLSPQDLKIVRNKDISRFKIISFDRGTFLIERHL
jgi:hypothetical protein